MVNHFRHANLQIGDKAFYTLKACDLRLVTSDGFLVRQQTSDNDNTEGLDEVTDHTQYISPPSESQTEGCGVNEDGNAGISKSTPVKTGLEEVFSKKGDVVVPEGSLLSSEGSSDSVVTENDSKSSSKSTSTTSLCDSNIPTDSITEETSLSKKEATVCDGNEASGGTNQADIHETHHTAGSDSAEGDEDSDGGETVTPKAKGTGSLKHDSGLSHGLRYPTKRRKKRLRRKRKTAPPLKVNVGDKVCVEVTHTCTTVDVIWQNGSTQDKILSTDLIPVFHLDELEFFPGDYVSDKRGEVYDMLLSLVFFKLHRNK